MKPLLYLIIYSFFGFLLERIINILFLGGFYDNSVLYGPYQPMYGLGVVLTLYAYLMIKKIPIKWPFVEFLLIWLLAILFTGFSEYISGTLYEYFTGIVLWDYSLTFTWCTNPYSCFLPTSIFALLAVFTVIYIHPFISMFLKFIPRIIKWLVILAFLIDVILTYKEVLL
jgi:uncharacterized membrane protein